MASAYLLLVLMISQVQGGPNGEEPVDTVGNDNDEEVDWCSAPMTVGKVFTGRRIVDRVIFEDFEDEILFAKIGFTADGEEFMLTPRRYGNSSRLLVQQGYVEPGNEAHRYISEPLSTDGIRIEIVDNFLTIFNGTTTDSAAAFIHTNESVSGRFRLLDVTTYITNLTMKIPCKGWY
ncbi:hypothetical protein CAPTEDRAFT_224000 [Capitella teleta]|uniref:Laminin G domain-containing protein n=1 Tax=Capitella teleta TaxID=283909 RepID=R7T7P7_CAPTE|nr:hypothetical protein CAPTEDRAFT_224000 [Capitella teleta]|eukprot:ELT87445.1 hypothetical protein CAPTEDRAFT_224000 [Capitella teleta]